jgi:hypothetical protein
MFGTTIDGRGEQQLSLLLLLLLFLLIAAAVARIVKNIVCEY